MEPRQSKIKLRAIWLTTILLCSSIFTIPFAGVAVAGNKPLEDNGIYWQGQIRTAGNAASPNEPVTVNDTSTDEAVLNLTADENGDVNVNTTTLDSQDYSLNNSSGAGILEFEVVIQSVSASYDKKNLRNGVKFSMSEFN